MFKNIKKLVTAALSVTGLWVVQPTLAQSGMPDPFAKLSAPSATTASLTKFTDIPVNGYTGTPDIGVPLYEIKTSFVNIPITLNYHGSGITVTQNASNIGLGWALSAGGVLSRSVLGLPDNNSWQTYRMSRTSSFDITDSIDYQQADPLYSGNLDGVPDLYMYNLPGYSGKFIIADQIRQLPMTNLKIVKISNDEYHITTPEGNKYIFSAPETSFNRSVSSGGSNTVAWYLTKILSATRTDSVVFTYANTGYQEEGGRNQSIEFFQSQSGVWDGGGSSTNTGFTNSVSGKQLTKITFNQGSVDFNISWNTREDLSPVTDGATPLINSIYVKNSSGTILRTISFRYDYFTNSQTGPVSKRLRLLGVYLNGGSSTDTLKAQRYNFLYNPTVLPSKNSFSQDHWGYYNGANNGSNLIPTYTNCVENLVPGTCFYCSELTSTLTYNGANREPNATYAAAGMLERVSYPTGGYTNFEWEANTIANNDPAPTTYQDLAVASSDAIPTGSSFVTDSSADFYINPATYPSGLCAKISGFLSVPGDAWGDAARINHASGSINVYQRSGRQLVATLTFPYSSTDIYEKNANVTLSAGQSYFIVTRVRDAGFDVSGTLTGKVKVTLPKPPNKIVGGCRLKKMTFVDPVASKTISKSYEYTQPDNPTVSSGLLYREPLYYKEIRRFEKVVPTPGCGYEARYGIRLYSNSQISLGSGSHVGYTYIKENIGEAPSNGYILYQYANPGSSETEFNATWRSGYLVAKTVYDTLGTPQTRESYKYSIDTRGRATYEGSTLDFFIRHPCALPNVFDASAPTFASGKNYHFPSEWIHQDTIITEIFDQNVSSRVLTNSKAFTYNNVNHLQVNQITERNSEGLDLISTYRYPLDYTLPTGTLSQEAQAIKDMQTANMHAPIEAYAQKKLSSGALQTQDASYIAYKSLSTPQGPVVLFDKQYQADIIYPSGTFTPSAVSGNGIAKNAAYVLKATATQYDAAYNISETEKRGNILNAYLWDYNRNYMVAQFNNARLADVAFSSFEADAKGNWNYGGANVADATAITGKNSYNLATGAISKTGLTTSNTYIVSYWTKNSTAYTITGTISGYPIKGSTVNGWTYFEHKVTGVSSVTLSGTGQIDELRLFPATANAITYTYDPLVGVISICSEGNKVSYYSYDSNGRLVLIKDQNGKILKQVDYQYQAAVNQ